MEITQEIVRSWPIIHGYHVHEKANIKIHHTVSIIDICSIGENCTIDYSCIIDHCVISNGCSIEADCTIGKHCFVGKHCQIGLCCEIGEGCSIRDHCTILDGCSFGRYCSIGENCTIKRESKMLDSYVLDDNCTINHSPLYIQGSRHACLWTGPNELAIGCEIHDIEHWKANFTKIGKLNDYTPEQIDEYKRYIDLFATDTSITRNDK